MLSWEYRFFTPCPLALSVRVASRREAEGIPNAQCPMPHAHLP
ncbi:hypothetical protein [Nostoc sp. DedQUE04]|nr:hypothetical protein [Nostoc sp. DedQUE04]